MNKIVVEDEEAEEMSVCIYTTATSRSNMLLCFQQFFWIVVDLNYRKQVLRDL